MKQDDMHDRGNTRLLRDIKGAGAGQPAPTRARPSSPQAGGLTPTGRVVVPLARKPIRG